MGFVKWMDKAPLWLKVVFALPFLDIVWAIYRLVKGVCTGKMTTLLGGILWLLAGWAILWIIDIVSIVLYKKPKILA